MTRNATSLLRKIVRTGRLASAMSRYSGRIASNCVAQQTYYGKGVGRRMDIILRDNQIAAATRTDEEGQEE